MTLSLNGRNISTDGSGRIDVNDIGHGDGPLICQSSTATRSGDWYLHPTELTTEEQDRIKDTSQGWFSTKAIAINNQQVRLRRAVSPSAQEGVFTCHIRGDSDTPISVGIYYPSEYWMYNKDPHHLRVCDLSTIQLCHLMPLLRWCHGEMESSK